MASRRRPFSSLFWTFATAFLAVMVAAVLLQGWVVINVVDRLTDERVTERANTLIKQTRAELEALSERPDDQAIIRILRRFSLQDKNIVILFKHTDKRLLPDRFLSMPLAQMMTEVLDGYLPAGRPPRPPRPPGRPPPGRNSNGPPPNGPPPPHLGAEPPTGQEAVLLNSQRIRIDDAVIGELMAVHLRESSLSWPLATDYQLLMFIPVALLFAGGGGLLIFRLLLRRLRRLEHFAVRLSDGDLDARIPVMGNDEIDHLGERFNRMAIALTEARNRAELSEQQRSQLLADISHELGTPLTAIRGYAETLLNPAVPKSAHEHEHYLRHMLSEAKRMDALIQDLLELTRLETEASALHLEVLDWAALCAHTLHRFESRFQQAGITLQWQGQEPAWILADGRRMEQVSDNLLVNALRYVPRGSQVILSVQPAENVPGYVRLRIDDDGPGVPEQALAHLFDRFYRADGERSIPGTGLGLAIVKEIVIKHGGRIYAELRQPSGLSIIVELPVSRKS